jgi:hypothetical protein
MLRRIWNLINTKLQQLPWFDIRMCFYLFLMLCGSIMLMRIFIKLMSVFIEVIKKMIFRIKIILKIISLIIKKIWKIVE